MGKPLPFTPEQKEHGRNGIRLLRERLLQMAKERHLLNNTLNGRDEGLTLLAQELGIKRQAVAGWTMVPWPQVYRVAQFTGLPPHLLHPLIPVPSDH